MAQINLKAWIVGYHFDCMPEGAVSWRLRGWKPEADSSGDTVAVIEHEVVIDEPVVNVVAAQVAALEAAKTKALEAYQKTVAELNERLSKLQAITYEATS
jgi:hypothetical protein